jgi:hypothetical protein
LEVLTVSPLSLIPLFFAVALVAPAAWALAKVYRRSHGVREITCPEANHFATIELDARHAVARHALGETDRRVKSCSLWPERQGCGQACVK